MTPNGGDARPRLQKLSKGLLRLHSVLLASEKALYERDIEKISNQGQYLNLVLNHQSFAWLRELSQFIVLIDEAAEAKEIPGRPEGDRLVAQARALLSPSEGGGGFQSRYYEAMQRDPGVILAHSEALDLLRSLVD